MLGGAREAGGPSRSRAAQPWMPGSGGLATHEEPRLLGMILSPSRHPGKEGRAGPPEQWERRPLVGMSARRQVMARQPPRASFYKANMGWPRRPRAAVMPVTRIPVPPSRQPRAARWCWNPLNNADPTIGCLGSGRFNHQTIGERGESGGPPNALRFCCRGVRRSRAAPQQKHTSRGCAAHTPRSAASAG